jgi:hypothetical protein
VPLEDVLSRYLRGRTAPLFQPSDDPKTISGYLQQVAGVLLDVLLERVKLDLPVARSSLISVLSRRERLMQQRIQNIWQFDPSLESKRINRMTGLLHGALSYCGGLSPEVIRNLSTKGAGRFLGWFEGIAGEIAILAMSSSNIRRGEREVSFDGSRFTFTKTARHTASVESFVNFKRQQRNNRGLDEMDFQFSPEALEAQEMILGFTARNILQLCTDGFQRLKQLTEVHVEREVCLVRVPTTDEWLSNLLNRCTLAQVRWCEFRSPFFFDFGVRAALPLPERDALLNSTGGNWSVYYPFCSI